MNFRLILHIIGIVLVIVSLFMSIPGLIAMLYHEETANDLILACLITLASGGLLYGVTRRSGRQEVRHREAFLIVTLSWLAVVLFGSLPYLLSGTFLSFTDAYFEAMAGLTTTGSSVLADIEAVPKGVLFWRSLSQWIGGMGIILFAIAILPLLGTGGMQLFKAEVPEISVDKLKPRIIDTAKSLWMIYVGITVAAAASYLAGGMDLYDAVSPALTTMATGGFSTKNASMGHFENPFIAYAAGIFMFMAGINYTLYFFLFRGRLSVFWKSDEFRFYAGVTLLATMTIAANVWLTSPVALSDAVRHAFFQVTSIMTTTGYVSADFEQWAPFSHTLLVILMFFGGMIGSTGGGIKQVRILLMLKQGYREIYQLIHPHAVTSVKLDSRFLAKEVLGSIWGFLFLFLFTCIVATLLLTATGTDMVTSATTVISSMCNVGPALGDAGPTENYAAIPGAGKWVLIFCMLAGRLEIYTVLIMLAPQFWKK